MRATNSYGGERRGSSWRSAKPFERAQRVRTSDWFDSGSSNFVARLDSRGHRSVALCREDGSDGEKLIFQSAMATEDAAGDTTATNIEPLHFYVSLRVKVREISGVGRHSIKGSSTSSTGALPVSGSAPRAQNRAQGGGPAVASQMFGREHSSTGPFRCSFVVVCVHQEGSGATCARGKSKLPNRIGVRCVEVQVGTKVGCFGSSPPLARRIDGHDESSIA